MEILRKLAESKNVYYTIALMNVSDLEKAIGMASYLYHQKANSPITDEVYDLLVERLKALKPTSRVLKQIGAPIEGKKVKLPYWMGSMNKIKSDEHELEKWVSNYPGPYVISNKLDGISCLLIYKNREFRLYTRGDGAYGKDITHLLDYVNVFLKDLEKNKKDVAIRGELIMSKKNFRKYENIMSNARNMVGGIVNSKPSSLDPEQAEDVDLLVYEIIEPIMKPSDQFETLQEWGLKVAYYDIYKNISSDILNNILQERKESSKYEVDGIIVTQNKVHHRNTSGNPPYSFAFKGTTATANVKVIDVIWTASKDGYLVPRVHFAKVRLSQADLEYATGFNAKFIVENGIGPGALITVVRSNEVIPYILAIIKESKLSGLPKNVPYHWDKNKVNIILDDYENDKGVIIKRLTKFMKDIKVDNLSEGIITRLVDAGYDSILKMVQLTEKDFLELPGFKKTLAHKLSENLQNRLKELDLLTLMVASNIFGRGLGRRKLKHIMNEYPDIVREYKVRDYEEWEDKIKAIEGFDTITTNQFLDELPKFQKFYHTISGMMKIKSYRPPKKTGLFKNMVVVFTGFRNAEWQAFIEENGGKVTTSVSKNTTLLVYNDGEENTSKYKKAVELGIKTISRSAFERKYIK